MSGHVAKSVRGDISLTDARALIRKELGDILWNVAVYAKLLGYDLSEIAEENQDKIVDRIRRGVIMGNGDNR